MSKYQPDALDFQIIHALQIDPRVPWSALAGALGVDALTLARRWERIEKVGVAWLSAVQGVDQMSSVALVEIECHPGHVLRTAEIAATLAPILSIELAVGAADLLLTVVAQSEDELAEYLLETIGLIPGVRATHAHIVSKLIRVGSDWRLQVLTEEQKRRLPPPRRPRPGSAKRIGEPLATALRTVLHENARMSYRDIAAHVGISPQRAADAIARLRLDGELVLRADVSERYTLYPAVNWLFLQLPASRVVEAMAKLERMDEIQFAAVCTGPANVVLATSAATRLKLLQVEVRVSQQMPEAVVQNRITMLRLHKHLGRAVNARDDGPTTAELASATPSPETPAPGPTARPSQAR